MVLPALLTTALRQRQDHSFKLPRCSPRHLITVSGMVRLISWNIARRSQPWAELDRFDPDVLLLQEARVPAHGATWGLRYDTVFDRAEALGLHFVGPQHPNGRQADPWPEELPATNLCVPTFHHNKQSPATESRQLDFAFVSASLADRVEVRALNDIADWGPSDHCRVLIDYRL